MSQIQEDLSNLNCCSGGKCVQETLGDCDFTLTGSPCSILFPASHGYGLTSTVLIQFLIDCHNIIVKKHLSTKINPGETKVDLPVISCREIVDMSMLVTVDAQVEILVKPVSLTNAFNLCQILGDGHNTASIHYFPTFTNYVGAHLLVEIFIQIPNVL